MTSSPFNSFDKYAVSPDILTVGGQFNKKRQAEQAATPKPNPADSPTPHTPEPAKGRAAANYDHHGQRNHKINLDEAYDKWSKDPSPHNMQLVVNKSKPVISAAMASYAGGDNPILKGQAKRIVINSVKSYKPQDKSSLKSWMMLNLQGLRRHSSSLTPIRAPERVKLDNYAISQAIHEHQALTGTDPTDQEIADRTGLSTKRIDYVRNMIRTSLSEGQYLDATASEGTPLHAPAEEQSSWEDIWLEYVYHDLDPINKKIFDMRMRRGAYADKQLGINDMAKELNMSAAAVSQRANRIADKIAAGYQYKGAL